MTGTHGGDWAGFEQEYGTLPLDFSASISPLGVPEGVLRAICDAAARADRYPDPSCRALRAAIGDKEGVPAENILCGNGAAELIYRAVLARKPKRALVTDPSFSEYEAALKTAGCQIAYHALRREKGFVPDDSILQDIDGMDIVFLCQPNNPTGVSVPMPLLRRVLERCRAAGALLVADECFVDLMDEPEAHTLVGELSCGGGLLILRSFTKLYAMAGIRLGYCLSADRTFLEAMAAGGPPWSVSELAQTAGLAALEETAYAGQVRTLVRDQRPKLRAALEGLGLSVIPGEANYLLFQSPIDLAAPLARRGILLRGCGGFRGLDGSWYRAAVRTGQDNERLIEAIREALAHG